MTRYYLDTEFNGFGGALLSLGLVSEYERSLYVVIQDETTPTTCDPWVAANVVPFLHASPVPAQTVTRQQARELLIDYFAGDPNPTVITDWPDDIRYFCELLITGPGMMLALPSMNFEMKRVDAYPTALVSAVQHNAMWDALALRHRLVEDEDSETNTQNAGPVADDECAQDVFRHGQSIGLFDIPKEAANAICAGITTITGVRLDWHYIGGRVHLKALPGIADAKQMQSISDQMADLVDRLGSQWKEVDPRAWAHLLVYAPPEAYPETSRVAASKIRPASEQEIDHLPKSVVERAIKLVEKEGSQARISMDDDQVRQCQRDRDEFVVYLAELRKLDKVQSPRMAP